MLPIRGKRMTRFAEHLIDRVLPVMPIRQWVLTVPHRLRYRMAYDHDLSILKPSMECSSSRKTVASHSSRSPHRLPTKCGVLEDLICRLQPILRRFGLHAEDEHEGEPKTDEGRTRVVTAAHSLLAEENAVDRGEGAGC